MSAFFVESLSSKPLCPHWQLYCQRRSIVLFGLDRKIFYERYFKQMKILWQKWRPLVWTQVDTCFSVLSSGGEGTLGKGMVIYLFVLNRVSLSRLIWYARWILFVLQVYKSNDVSLLWRGFCPLSLTGWKNLGCCAKQGMYFRVFLSLTEKSNPRWLTYAQMVEYPPPLPSPRYCNVRIEEVRFWLVTRV